MGQRHSVAVNTLFNSCNWPDAATRVLPGILLAVTIIYQYFETYDKEKSQGQVNLW